MLRLANVAKRFTVGLDSKVVAVDGMDLLVAKGQFVVIIGSNGSGKTTLLNLIAGSLNCSEGRIYVEESDVTDQPEYKRAEYIARIFQDPTKGVAPSLTVVENLGLAELRGRVHGLAPVVDRRKREVFHRLLADPGLGLEARLSQKAGTLSGGERQLLAVVMATLRAPKVLLLDEHCASLDPTIAPRVMEATARYIREKALTTMMVTHNLDFAAQYGDRLIMMHRGQIIFDVVGQEKMALSSDDILAAFRKASHGGQLPAKSVLR